MSSKKLQFKETRASIKKKLFNDLDGMEDISFTNIMQTSDFITDIQRLTKEESVMQSLRNLMSLPVGGNVLFPTRGETVGNMLFSPGLFQDEAKAYIISYLASNEPRITINDVTATKKINDFNEQIVTLNVSYSFKNSTDIYNTIIDLKSTLDGDTITLD